VGKRELKPFAQGLRIYVVGNELSAALLSEERQNLFAYGINEGDLCEIDHEPRFGVATRQQVPNIIGVLGGKPAVEPNSQCSIPIMHFHTQHGSPMNANFLNRTARCRTARTSASAPLDGSFFE